MRLGTLFRATIDSALTAWAKPAPRPEILAEGVLLVDSGTTALQLILGRGPSAPVALPAYGCFDLVTAVVGAKRRVAFYDLEPETLAPVWDSVADCLARGASDLVIVSHYGIPPDWTEVRERIPADVTVIDDAAQAFGASVLGIPAGFHGDYGILSFGRGKGWTGGGGGALIGAPPAAWLPPADARESSWASLARGWGQWALARPNVLGALAGVPALHVGDTVYRAPTEPRRASRFSEALVCRGWGHAAAEAERRKRSAEAILRELQLHTSDLRSISVPANAEASYLRLPVLLPGSGRTLAADRSVLRLGLGPPYPVILPELPQIAASRVDGSLTHFPGAREIVRTLVTLPTHSQMTPRERHRLVALVRANPPR